MDDGDGSSQAPQRMGVRALHTRAQMMKKRLRRRPFGERVGVGVGCVPFLCQQRRIDGRVDVLQTWRTTAFDAQLEAEADPQGSPGKARGSSMAVSADST